MPSDAHRIVLVMTWDVSLSLWAEKGLLQREIRFYEELDRRGVDVTILSWGSAEGRAVRNHISDRVKIVSVYDRLRRPRNKIIRAFYSLCVPFIFRDIFLQTSIIKTNQMWGAWVPVVAKLVSKKKLLVRCGYELHDFTVRQGHGYLRCSFIWLISWAAYRLADEICVATVEDQDYVHKNFKVQKHKINVHPNWIDTDIFSPIPQRKQDNRILFVGRLNTQKNLKMLFSALEETGIGLDIVGDGELRDDLEKMAHEKNIDVRFLGRVPNDRMPQTYANYHLFVMPSEYEGNPKSLLEAMACGLAVLGTNVDGIRNVIRHNKTGWLCDKTEESIGSSLLMLIKDYELMQKMGQSARQQIQSDQALTTMLEKEVSLYDRMIEKVNS